MFRYWVMIFSDEAFVEESQVGRLAALCVLRGRRDMRVYIQPEYFNKKFIDWNDNLRYDESTEQEEVIWG